MLTEQDFIMRQVKSFAVGLGAVLGGHQESQPEIIIEQEQGQIDRIRQQLLQLLRNGHVKSALQVYYAQQWRLPQNDYCELGRWLLTKLEQKPMDNEHTIIALKKYLVKIVND